MKKCILKGVLSLVLLFAVSIISMGETFVTSSKDGKINLRQSATTDSRVLETLKNGEIIESTEKSGDWYKITYHDKGINRTFTGYIHDSQLKKIIGKFVVASSAGYATVREQPTTKSAIKKRVNNNLELYVVSKSDDWYYVNFYDGGDGYIHSSLLKKK